MSSFANGGTRAH